MTTATQSSQLLGKDLFLADHLRLLQQPVAGGRAWVDSLRKHGLDRFVSLGFPTQRDEAWRQTNLAPLMNTPLRAAFTLGAEEPASQLVEAFRYPGLTGPEIIFHDGRLVQIKGADHLPAGVQILDFSTALDEHKDLLEPHLGAYAPLDGNPFIALNTAFLEQGVAVIVPRGIAVQAPIHVIFLSTDGTETFHAHPRLLVLAGENSEVTLIETWGALHDDAVYFNNSVTEIAAAENAVVRHIKIQRESPAAIHIANVRYIQERGSQIFSHNVALGGRLVRNEYGATLNGEGGHCLLNGLYLTDGTRHVDNHTQLDHAMPHCTSHEVYKGILDDQSSAVFTGRIHVHPDAQKTDAIQSNHALLLSPTATVNSQPQLEIYADDVRCTHGATVGQLNNDALFYLRARGISRQTAMGLLTYAFANEIIEQIPVPAVHQHLEHLLALRFNILEEGAVR